MRVCVCVSAGGWQDQPLAVCSGQCDHGTGRPGPRQAALCAVQGLQTLLPPQGNKHVYQSLYREGVVSAFSSG